MEKKIVMYHKDLPTFWEHKQAFQNRFEKHQIIGNVSAVRFLSLPKQNKISLLEDELIFGGLAADELSNILSWMNLDSDISDSDIFLQKKKFLIEKIKEN